MEEVRISKLTLEPLPSPEEIYKEMVRLYLEEKGYQELYDAYIALRPVDNAKLGIELFSALEDLNRASMLKEGLCPDCAKNLRRRTISATREDPGEEYVECPDCREEFPELR